MGYKRGSTGPFCLAGIYKGSAQGEAIFHDVDDHDSQLFQSSAMLFNTVRQQCAGRWEVTRSSVRLPSGSCSGKDISGKVFANSVPCSLDAMLVMVHSFAFYSPAKSRSSSPWRVPAFAVNTAAIYWSRMIWMNQYLSAAYVNNSEIYYPAKDEHIISTNATLDASWLLYLVLVMQPMSTIAGFFIVSGLYHVPIGRGFELVAILAGIEKEGLALLKGAALSGELRQPVSMDISVHAEGEEFAIGRSSGKIRYSLDPRGKRNMANLQRRRLYE
jgi:hypothetical protein